MTIELQNTILEMIARGEPLKITLEKLCQQVEIIAPDAICSVLAVERGHLKTLAAPSLPTSYTQEIDGLRIGPQRGSCGTAAYLDQPVIVTDISTDVRWMGFSHLALEIGFVACWSTPIKSGGKVVGTFAFYYRTSRGPTPREQSIVDACVHLCAIAIERDQRVLERERLTYTDWLTGLSNRVRFHDVIAQLPKISGSWGVLLADIDNLKVVNDTFGHSAGDDLIKDVAARISEFARAGEAFRLGGDEFAIIIQRQAQDIDLNNEADAVLQSLRSAALCSGHMIFPAATIGGAIYTDEINADAVLKYADLALYHAKERRRGHFVEYTPSLGTAITRRYRAVRDVQIALREDRLRAFYQPIVRLDTQEIIGFEALCRMQTATGEIIAAANFHEATKDAKVASDLTQRMLVQVARDLRGWLDLGLPVQHVGINLSAADLHGGTLSQRLCTVFGDAGVPLKHVILEVTESVAFGQKGTDIAGQIKQLRARGLKVALDDFGTGYASLTHLLDVPVDVLKIDKSFVDRLGPTEPASFIIEGVTQIAHKLGIRVVAEGVEQAEQADLLMKLGCILGQGYLYSKAVDERAAAALLRRFGQALPEFDSQRQA